MVVAIGCHMFGQLRVVRAKGSGRARGRQGNWPLLRRVGEMPQVNSGFPRGRKVRRAGNSEYRRGKVWRLRRIRELLGAS